MEHAKMTVGDQATKIPSPCVHCGDETLRCNADNSYKCPTRNCDNVIPVCIADINKGTCVGCATLRYSYGKHVLDKIGKAKWCHWCWKRLVTYDSTKHKPKTRMFEDCRDARKYYHKRCWKKHLAYD